MSQTQHAFADEETAKKAKEVSETRSLIILVGGDVIQAVSIFRQWHPGEDPDDFLVHSARNLLTGRMKFPNPGKGNGGTKTAEVTPNAVFGILKEIDDSEKKNQIAEEFQQFCEERGWMDAYLSLVNLMGWKRNLHILKAIREKKVSAGNTQSVLFCTRIIEQTTAAPTT